MGLFKKKPKYDVKAEIQVVMKNGVVITTEHSLTDLKNPDQFDDYVLNLLNSPYFKIKDPASGFKTLIPIDNIDKLLYNPKVIEKSEVK